MSKTKPKPMTSAAIDARIKKLGGLNERTALIVSIEKWERLGKCEFEKMTDAATTGDTCALCRYHHFFYRGYSANAACGDCPLKDSASSGCSKGSPFSLAREAIYFENKPVFMKARRNLLRRMRRALKRLKEGEEA